MRIILLLLLTVLSFCCFAQRSPDLLQGSWVKTKTEVLNLSSASPRDMPYCKIEFADSLLHIHTHPMYEAKGACYSFEFRDDKIHLSGHHYYEVTKLGSDELVLLEMKEDELLQHTLVRSERLFEQIQSEQSNSRYRVAKPGYTPKLNRPIERLLDSAFVDQHVNFQARGTLLLDLENETVFSAISYSTIRDIDPLRLLKKTLDSTFPLWDLTGFGEAKLIQIPFVVQDVKLHPFAGFSMVFLTSSIAVLDKPVQLQKKYWSDEYFHQGILAVHERAYRKAIRRFDSSLELNPENQHAVFSRAKVYLIKGREEDACRDWKMLIDQGFEKAQDYYEGNCKAVEDSIPSMLELEEIQAQLLLPTEQLD